MTQPDLTQIPFELLQPPKRHETEFVTLGGRLTVIRHVHAILPEPFIDIVNQASQEDLKSLIHHKWIQSRFPSSPRSQS